MSTSEIEQSARDAILLEKLRKYMTSEDMEKKHHPNQYLRTWFSNAELVSAKSGHGGLGELVWRYPIQEEYLNAHQQYGGGAQAAVHDACTGWTLLTIARPNYWSLLGSTRTLNMSYFKGPKPGDMLRLECKIVHIGSRLAMVRGTLVREHDGQIISTSEHHLYNNERAVTKL